MRARLALHVEHRLGQFRHFTNNRIIKVVQATDGDSFLCQQSHAAQQPTLGVCRHGTGRAFKADYVAFLDHENSGWQKPFQKVNRLPR